MATAFAVLGRDNGARPDPDCQACTDLQSDNERLTIALAKAHQLLRQIRKADPKPARPEGIDDDATELLLIAHAKLKAEIDMRIDLYAQSARVKL